MGVEVGEQLVEGHRTALALSRLSRGGQPKEAAQEGCHRNDSTDLPSHGPQTLHNWAARGTMTGM